MASPGDAVVKDGQYEFWSPTGQSVLLGAGTQYRVVETNGLLGLAGVGAKDSDRDSAHGSFYGGREFMKGRTVQLDLALEAGSTSAEQLVDQLLAVFQPTVGEGIFTLKRANKVKRQITGKFRKAMFPGNYDMIQGFPKGAVEFFARDPRVYESVGHNDQVDPTIINSGRTYSRVYSYNYGGVVQQSSAFMNNIGNILLYPLIRIWGPCSNPRIQNVTTGEEILLNMSILAGSYVELDPDIHSALINGMVATRAAVDPTSRWFGLVPGVNELRFTNFTTETNCYAEVIWRSAWANG